MAREDVIDGLKLTVSKLVFNPSTGRIRTEEELSAEDKIAIEACEEAVRLLEIEPCEDAISREAAQCLFSTDLSKKDRKVSYQAMCIDAVFALENLPPVTPIRPKGHWIGIIDELTHEDWQCDVCGGFVWGILSLYDFCPNCGADMREDNNANSN